MIKLSRILLSVILTVSAGGHAALADETTALVQFHDGGKTETQNLPANGQLAAGGGRWSCRTVVAPVAGRDGCSEVTVTIKLIDGASKSTSVGYACDFDSWDPAGYILVPAIVYDGNKFDVLKQGYPPLWRDKSQFRLDMPVTFTDQPRLNKDGSPGKIELDTGSAAAPVMGFRTVDGRGFLLVTTQHCEFGNLGMTIEEDPANHHLRLLVSAPRMRSRIPGGLGFGAGDPPRDWKADDTATIRLHLWSFAAPTLQTLFDRFAVCRKDLNPSRPKNDIPFSEAWRLLQDKQNNMNWSEALGFYTHEMNITPEHPRPLYAYWQLGWVTGGINTLANLLQGNDLSRQRAMKTLDFMFDKTPTKSGLWYGTSNGKDFYGDAFSDPHPFNMTMVRKQGDGLAYGVKQLLLLRLENQPIPPAWEAAARAHADALVALWDKYGQLGEFADVETGDLLVGGSTAGAIVPAGLVRAADYFHEPRYLEKAKEIARYYVRNALQTGVTCGGPGEILSAPDSESAFALFESLVELEQATGDREWALDARDMARFCSTWVVSYDYAFPKDSPMGKIDARSTGAVWANVQNKHAAPAICTLSGDSLFKHWRATADEVALDLIHDIAHGAPQYLSRADQPVGDLGPGMMCERVNLSDWEGANNVGGNIFGSSPWPEIATMLVTAEIPGIYVNTDTKRLIVFDHVEASLDPAGTKLSIHNPTKFDAQVRLLCETNAEAAKPLGVWTLRHARIIDVPAGGTVTAAL